MSLNVGQIEVLDFYREVAALSDHQLSLMIVREIDQWGRETAGVGEWPLRIIRLHECAVARLRSKL